MTKYIAFIEFDSDRSQPEALAILDALVSAEGSFKVYDVDVNLANQVQLAEPVLIADNLPDDPFQFPHIKQLMEALTSRGDRYAD